MQGLFVTGTDTDVGKTWITSLIARQMMESGVRVGVYKPACSGSEQDTTGVYWSDIRALSAATADTFPEERICPQRFAAPLAPPVAAAAEGLTVDSKLLRDGVNWWREQVDYLLVEGVGGFLCPLTETETIADLAVDLGFPTLVVARATLGTINHTLLTLAAIQSRGLQAIGVILNEADAPDGEPNTEFAISNAAQIASFGKAPVLGLCKYNGRFVKAVVGGEPIASDWFSLFGCAE